MSSLKYWLWLATRPTLGNVAKLALLDRFQEPDGVYFADSEAYLSVEGITRSQAKALEDKSLEEADRILGECQRLDLRMITIRDAEYPDRLRNIYDPPILLYVQGRMPLFDEEIAVAMVGSRKASPASLQVTERLAFQMADLGALIVSGLAKGGDAMAHRGALRAGGFTAAVIAGGHDITYPMENASLYADIAARGVILSEYPPGTEHRREHFPARNRIISGLCLATVVSEAPERSGTLITASRALDQGRDVFAVPGPAGDRTCVGSNNLIREGAGLVTDAWDVLSHYAAQYPHKLKGVRSREPEKFGQEPSPMAARRREAEEPAGEREEARPELPELDLTGSHGLTDDQIRIVKALDGRTVQVDDLIDETQIPTRRVLSALTVLEVDGLVTQHSGKRFSLAVTLRQ